MCMRFCFAGQLVNDWNQWLVIALLPRLSEVLSSKFAFLWHAHGLWLVRVGCVLLLLLLLLLAGVAMSIFLMSTALCARLRCCPLLFAFLVAFVYWSYWCERLLLL
jgi:hypothetical protein